MPGLEDLYREIILDHYRNPRNRGELEVPPAHRAEGFNPLCGDEIVVYLAVDGGGRIEDVKIGGQGCSISQSSVSMMSAAVKGKTVEEARQLNAGLQGVDDHPRVAPPSRRPAPGRRQLQFAPTPYRMFEVGDLEALQKVAKFPSGSSAPRSPGTRWPRASTRRRRRSPEARRRPAGHPGAGAASDQFGDRGSIRGGSTTTTVSAGTSWVTTTFGPMCTLSPTRTLPSTTAPAPRVTWLPSRGASVAQRSCSRAAPASDELKRMMQSSPIFE